MAGTRADTITWLSGAWIERNEIRDSCEPCIGAPGYRFALSGLRKIGLIPGRDPMFDLFMRNALASIERGNGTLYAGNLPFVDLEICVDRLGGEKRPAPASAVGEFLQTLSDSGIDANCKGSRTHDFVSVFDCVHSYTRRETHNFQTGNALRFCA